MPLYGNRMARFGNQLVNNEYSLRFSKSISNTAKCFFFSSLFCLVFCFCLFCFCFVFVLFWCFCFVFVCLFVFSIHFKSWNEWCSHTKTSKFLRKWEIQKEGLDLAPQLLGEHIILQVLLDRGHNFFWIFYKVTKTLLGVIHKGWGLKSFFDSPIRGVGLEQKLPKVFQWKLSLFIWFAMGLTYNFHVKKGGPEI